MLTLIFTLTSYSIFLSIFTASTPLTLGLMILILALNLAMTTALTSSTWFGFIIFLIYIGGMLVMFAYFAALTPNTSPTLATTICTLLSTLTLLFIFTNKMALTLNHIPLINRACVPTLTLFSQNNLPTLLLLALALFLALISVVKISNLTAGPLRPFKTT